MGRPPFETTAKRFDNPSTNYYRGGVGNIFPSTGGETGVTRVLSFYPRAKLGGGNMMASSLVNNWKIGWQNTGGGIGLQIFLPSSIYTRGATHVWANHPVAGVGVTLNTWHTICISWNMTTGVCDYVFDGVHNTSYYTENVEAATSVNDVSTAEEYMGSGRNHGTGDYTNVDISQYWMDDQYIDFSVAGNVAKFVDGAVPVYLGEDGSLPTGTQPLHFSPVGDMSDNKGSQANWVEVGTVPDAPTSPTD